MTRENKLVMVIGFGLLLFVGILVSDHLSARDAQFSKPDSVVEVKYEKDQNLPPAEGPQVVEFGELARSPETAPQIEGVVIVKPEAPQVGGAPAPVAPSAPAERTHTVAKGENPEKIALKYYNKRSLATKLAEYNGIDPSKLKIGQIIKVPDIAVLDPKSAMAQAPVQNQPAQPQASQPPAPAKPAPQVNEPKARTVTVQKGDNLWKIAGRAYGKSTAANVKQLQSMNPGINPENLKTGSQLKI
jgi:nucleoid-associated protein YgaU